MNVNINLISHKKKFIKKLIILVIFALLCFFIKENVFASTNTSLPPFLEKFYNVSTTNATCDDETEGYCSIYTTLEQFFAEFQNLYKNVVFITQYNSYANIKYHYSIYFFLDLPYISETNYNNLNNANYLSFLDSDGNPLKYYRIVFDENYNNFKIEYFYEVENNTDVPIYWDERSIFDSLKTNFDLYSQNGGLYHESDVLNFTYINLPANSNIGLIPKVSDNLGSYFSYNKENLYGAWYDLNNETFETETIFDKPVTGSLTYNLDFSLYRVNDYHYHIINKGTTTAKIGYIEEDFDVIVYKDFYSDGVDKYGNIYKNPVGPLVEKIDKENENIFDSIANLPNKIISGLSSLIKNLFVPNNDRLEDFFTEQYNYTKNQLGFLVYPIEVVVDFANRFYDLDNTNSAVFKIPKIEIFNHTLYEGSNFDLMSIVNENENFKNIYNIYKIAVSGFIVLWLVQLAIKKEQEIFGGGSN